MKTLFLLRHAKSSWGDPAIDDHDRPLNERGRYDGAAMAELFDNVDPTPELVLCSTALRTRQTLDLILPHLAQEPRIDFLPLLYLASAQTLLQAIRTIDNRYGSALLVGHNDGLHDVARLLAGGGDAQQVKRLIAKFPTAGLARFTFEDGRDWRNVAPKTGILVDYATPKDAVV